MGRMATWRAGFGCRSAGTESFESPWPPGNLKVSAKNSPQLCAFTLVELLTVVAIIGVLATLLTSAVATAQRKARKTACISNLRQIALAYNLYTVDQRKRPPSFAAMAEEKL